MITSLLTRKQPKLSKLTSRGLEAIFQALLKFGQAIEDVIFVQKISNFW
jgi:hypothetical protein